MMQSQQVVADAEPELMTSWKAICDKYPHQWVVLVDTDWVEVHSFMFRSTRVFAHGATRAAMVEPARAAIERYNRCGVFHTKRTWAPPLPPHAS
jgi:hypothetical protein